MIKKKVCVFFSLVLLISSVFSSVFAQDSTSVATDTSVIFTDLSKALMSPEKVYKLKLKRDRLKEVPEEIFQFKNLRHLDLSHNDIASLPKDIGKLKNLQYLDLSKNHLTELPAEIGDMSELRVLVLNNNEIMGLPSSIGKLKKLQDADLWSNELSYFPEEISGLSASLKTLDLRGILIDDDQQKRLRAQLPSTKIFFSPGCNCGK